MWQWLIRRVHQSWMIVGFCAGIVAGMLLGMIFRVNYFGSSWWLWLVVLVMVVGYVYPRATWVGVAMMAGMVLAFFRISGELGGEKYVQNLVGANITVTGEIACDPETDEGLTKYNINRLRFGTEGVEAAGRIYVSGAKNEELMRGDTVELTGRLDSGFGVYAGYLYRPDVVNWRRPEPSETTLMIRNWFAERVRENVPEPEVKLGLSYLLGMKTGLDDELEESLRVVGLTHIVVASGTHLSILVEVARKIFGRLSRWVGFWFATGFVWFFMSMVGWTPSIMRAGLMTTLTLMAWVVGRKFAPWRIILLVAAITLMVEPSFLLNMGWQLSFASYAGIMMLGPRLTRYFYGEKKPGVVGGTVIATLSATVMTLPITLYHYGMMSLISVLANLLILPTLPWVMGLLFMSGLLVGIPGLAMGVGWCASKMLDYHLAVIGWLGEMKEFLVEIPKYQWWIFLIYCLIIGWIFCGKIKRICYNHKYE